MTSIDKSCEQQLLTLLLLEEHLRASSHKCALQVVATREAELAGGGENLPRQHQNCGCGALAAELPIAANESFESLNCNQQ